MFFKIGKWNFFFGRDLELLAVLLCNIAKFLGQESYLDHYIRDFPGLFKKIGICAKTCSQKTASSLFRWLEHCLQFGCSSANKNDLPPLIYKDGSSVMSRTRKIVSFYSLLCGGKQIGKKLSSGVHCNVARGSYTNSEELTVLAMVGERFGLQQLDSLPSGVSLPLRHVSWATFCSTAWMDLRNSVTTCGSFWEENDVNNAYYYFQYWSYYYVFSAEAR